MQKNSLGIVKTLQVGGDIEARCGKCGDMREHVIAAMSAAGKVERVQCRTCQSNHLYRERKTTTTRTASTRSSKKDGAPVVEASGPPRTYSMQERFAVGDRVEHPKFGSGLVVEVRAGKIDVKFGRETKTLVHAGA
jgi:DNA-directed RNA polymerase subunit RPC12/RpoP